MNVQDYWGKTIFVTPHPEYHETPYWSHFDIVKDGNIQSEAISIRGKSKEEVDELVSVKKAEWYAEFKKSPLERLKKLANQDHILDHDKEIMLKLITKILSGE